MSIHKYLEFIEEKKKEIEDLNNKINSIIIEEVIPGMRDIVEMYEDEYDVISITVCDENGNGKEIEDFDWEYDTINLYLEIDSGSASLKTLEEIKHRINSEFGDIINITYDDSNRYGSGAISWCVSA